MYKRLVADALAGGVLEPHALASYTDEGLLHHLERAHPSAMLDALRGRRLYKRALECPASEVGEGAEWIASDRALVVAVENGLARELALQPGELLLDFPEKTQMLGLDIPVVRRSGRVGRLTAAGLEGAINLPTLSDQLYRSARWLRVFVARDRSAPREALRQVISRPRDDVRERLAAGRLLG